MFLLLPVYTKLDSLKPGIPRFYSVAKSLKKVNKLVAILATSLTLTQPLSVFNPQETGMQSFVLRIHTT